jgi:hypothetical protein
VACVRARAAQAATHFGSSKTSAGGAPSANASAADGAGAVVVLTSEMVDRSQLGASPASSLRRFGAGPLPSSRSFCAGVRCASVAADAASVARLLDACGPSPTAGAPSDSTIGAIATMR